MESSAFCRRCSRWCCEAWPRPGSNVVRLFSAFELETYAGNFARIGQPKWDSTWWNGCEYGGQNVFHCEALVVCRLQGTNQEFDPPTWITLAGKMKRCGLKLTVCLACLVSAMQLWVQFVVPNFRAKTMSDGPLQPTSKVILVADKGRLTRVIFGQKQGHSSDWDFSNSLSQHYRWVML